ncbi:MAG: hypothetical protein ACE5KS_09730, partial [Woeseiaceae bacterium]
PDIVVNSVKFIKGSKKLITNIDVGGDEDIEAEFEIEVQSRRGRGRGTTFYVFEKNSGKTCAPWPGCKEDPQNPGGGLRTCNEIYGASSCYLYDPLNPTSTEECLVSRGNDNSPGFTFFQNCKTSETLVVPADEPLMAADDGVELHLVGPWFGGRSAIVNGGRTARIVGFTIVAHGAGPNPGDPPSVADGACHGTVGEDPTQFQYGSVSAAVTLIPHLGVQGPPDMTATRLHITTTHGARFCNVLESASNETDLIARTTDTSDLAAGSILDNVIDDDSYSQYGALAQYVNLNDGDANVGMSNNIIGYSQFGCAAIKVGPWVEKTGIENNVIVTPGGGDGGAPCAGDGVSIEVEDSGIPDGPSNLFHDDAPVRVNKNLVDTTQAGATTGIKVTGSAVGQNEGNEITCDAGDSTYDLGVNVTDNTQFGLFPTKGKRKNTAIGSMTEIIQGVPGESSACPSP